MLCAAGALNTNVPYKNAPLVETIQTHTEASVNTHLAYAFKYQVQSPHGFLMHSLDMVEEINCRTFLFPGPFSPNDLHETHLS